MPRGLYLRARCAGYDTDIFFEFGVGRYNRKKVNFAKSICNLCPIESDCLRDNLGAQYGIFGGTTPLERWHLIGMPGHPGMISITYSEYNKLFARTSEGVRIRKKTRKRILDRMCQETNTG